MTETVYFIRSGGRIKVGFTKNLAERLKSLGSTYFEPIELIGSIPGGYRVEKAIHKRLRPHRIKNEWFCDCEEVISVINDALLHGAGAVDRPKIPKVSETHRNIMTAARETWPRSIPEHLMFLTGVSRRTVEGWLSDQHNISSRAIERLLHSEFGYIFLSAILGERRPRWWVDAQADLRRLPFAPDVPRRLLDAAPWLAEPNQ